MYDIQYHLVFHLSSPSLPCGGKHPELAQSVVWDKAMVLVPMMLWSI